MKILNISTIIPLKGLMRDNDIILLIQNYLKKNYNYEFIIAKPLPYASSILAKFNTKWATYRNYQQNGHIKIEDYDTFIFPWLAPPTSNLWINYLLIPFNYLWYQIKVKKRLVLFSKDVDLIVTQNIIPDSLYGYWLSKKLKKPYIINIRNGVPLVLTLYPISIILKNALAIVTPSPLDYKKFKDKLNIQLLPHPINNLFFADRRELIDLSTIKLISVCRLLDLKHLDWVINALVTLKSKGYNFEYNIVGDGPEFEKLRLLTRFNNLEQNIIFHGFLDQQPIQKLLKESHIFIMPSYPEALGIAFLEAAAANCLIIGHENSGVDGLLKHKHSAIFVNKNTIERELLFVFNNISQAFLNSYINNARKIVDEITWDKIGVQYNKLYSK